VSWVVIASSVLAIVAVIFTVVAAVINHRTWFVHIVRLEETNRRLEKALKDIEDLERWVNR
jgi:uncharacterized membrane protein YphA (DoxX/SURF4 family)